MNRVVREVKGHLEFPPQIPNQRCRRELKYNILCCIVLITVGCCFTKLDPWWYIYVSMTVPLLYYASLELILRACSIAEEIHHLHSHYRGQLLLLLQTVFSFNYLSFLSIMFSGFSIPIILWKFNDMVFEIDLSTFVAMMCTMGAIYFYRKLIKLEESKLTRALCLSDNSHLDYGSGMAFSFFYGYLNLILPCTGDERKGLKEQISDYEATHNVVFPTKKLFILIPLSGFCPPSISDHSSIMESAQCLNWRIMNRAGVRDRVYHNSVYKVWSKGTHVLPDYVCAEYASPLLTLYEIMRQNTPESRLYKKYQYEIITNFYVTLRNLIRNNRDCRGLCELIYYKDLDENNEPLDELDVGLYILEHLNR